MEAAQTGSPMTYLWRGKQYIVVAISGPNVPGQYVAFALPDPSARRGPTGAQQQ
jgi:quinoprotein glucose dehydrogenase